MSTAVSEVPAAVAPPLLTRGADVRSVLGFAALSVLLAGLLYPALGTWLGGALFPEQARGSLQVQDGRVLGSLLAAQPFAGDQYFHPRPSAIGYDPMSVGGSNLAASNPELRARMRADSIARAARENIEPSALPAELISASGSGIDPHLSPTAMAVQVARVARSRSLSVERVQALVDAHTEAPLLGVFGQSRVNVLAVNIALDQASR